MNPLEERAARLIPLLEAIRKEHGTEVMKLCRQWYLTGLNDAISHLMDTGAMTSGTFAALDPS